MLAQKHNLFHLDVHLTFFNKQLQTAIDDINTVQIAELSDIYTTYCR